MSCLLKRRFRAIVVVPTIRFEWMTVGLGLMTHWSVGLVIVGAGGLSSLRYCRLLRMSVWWLARVSGGN